MHSQLFRRETSRRLRSVKDQVIEAYLESRPRWLNAYSHPHHDGLRTTLDMLAEAISRGDVSWYREYTASYLGDLVQSGIPPIVVLATGDLLHEIILGFLTPDQRDLVRGIFHEERTLRQSIVYDRVFPLQARGA